MCICTFFFVLAYFFINSVEVFTRELAKIKRLTYKKTRVNICILKKRNFLVSSIFFAACVDLYIFICVHLNLGGSLSERT